VGKLIILATVVLALVAFVAASAGPALGGGGNPEVIKRGSCSGAADWKLKAKLDDGRIETEFEVDQNVNGREWRVIIRQNGVKRFDGVRTTHAPSGSFEVRRLLDNKAGEDRILAKAFALGSDQVCRGALTI
jgi:hypothetical protein